MNILTKMNLENEIKKRQERTRQLIFDLMNKPPDNKPDEESTPKIETENDFNLNRHKISSNEYNRVECFKFKNRISNFNQENVYANVSKSKFSKVSDYANFGKDKD